MGHGGGASPSIIGSAGRMGALAKELISSGVGTIGVWSVAVVLAGSLGAPVCDVFFHALAKCLFLYFLSTAASS